MKKFWVFLLLATLVLASCAPQPTVTAPQPQAGGADSATEVVPNAQSDGSPTAAVTQTQAAETTSEEPSQTASEQVQVINRALTTEPTGLDPHGPAGSGQNAILPFLFDNLVYRDTDNSYKPFLAESWETSKDGTSITFTLKEGITFSDGSPLDAEAVKFSFERLKETGTQSPIAGSIAGIESIEAVDDVTVLFNFSQPSTTFMNTIATTYAGIVSPTAAQESGEGFAQNPVGSGPFILETWEPGVAITLKRNPNYSWAPPVVQNQGAPGIDQLVFKIIPDSSAQLTAFQAGEVDILFVNNPGQLAALRNDPNAEVVETTLNSLIYLGFNSQKPPFDDVKVRQALSHAVNKEEIVQTALGGIGEVAFAPLAPTLPGFDPSLKENELVYDPEKSKALLSEAGFTQEGDTWTKDGQPLTLTLLTSTRPPNPSIATVLQAQFKAIGVTVEVQQLESQAAMEASSKGEFDLLLWRYDWNDADVLYTYLSSGRIGRTNRTFYSNPELDQLLEQALVTLDETERNQLYLQAQQMILQDAPWQPIYTPKDFMVIRKPVTGVVMGPMGRMLLNDAAKTGE